MNRTKSKFYFAVNDRLLAVRDSSSLLNAVLWWQCMSEGRTARGTACIYTQDVFGGKSPLTVNETTLYWSDWRAAILADTYGENWEDILIQASRSL